MVTLTLQSGAQIVVPASMAYLVGANGNPVAVNTDGSLNVTAEGDAVATGALGALSAVVAVPMSGHATVGFHLAAGTLAATVIPVISYDGGATWLQTKFYDQVLRILTPFYVLTNPSGALNATILTSGGVTHAGVQVSLWTSGTAAATVTATAATEDVPPDRGGGVTFQSAVSSSVNGTAMNVRGYASAVLTISGTFTATVFFEGSEDSTTGVDGTWSSINGSQLGTFNVGNNAVAPGDYVLSVSGLSWIRARIVWVSGTSVTVTGHASQNAWSPHQLAALLVQLINGENPNLNRLMNAESWSVTEITTQTTSLIKTGAGILGGFLIPLQVATATIKIFDSLAASGTVLMDTYTVPASPTPLAVLRMGFTFSTGLTVVTAVANQNVHVFWL